jgi:tyrosinase
MAPLVRRSVWTLPAGDHTLDEYAKAVAAMKGRSASDPTSWTYQAAMHGTYTTPVKPLWNGCQHGTWYFVAWHRMFLYWFERIVRAAVVQAGGNPQWTLPFWNYGAGGQQAKLPTAFRQPTTNNPLYEGSRNINGGQALSSLVTSATTALSRPSFTGVAQFGGGVTPVQQFSNATGRLEQTPHNDVHVAVGGIMSDPDTAAADPIFWLHHCNIDRLWFEWNHLGHNDPTDPHWLNQKFEFFDEHGHKVTMTAAHVRHIETDLDYTYERVKPPPPPKKPAAPPAGMTEEPPAAEPELVGASDQPVQLVGAPVSVPVEIDQRAHESFLAQAGAEAPRNVYLSIDDIEAEKNPGKVYGVYVNLPEDASPDEAERHYVGNVSFFGIERARNPRGDEQAHSLRFVQDITELSQDLAKDGKWDGKNVTVTFRPLDATVPEEKEEVAHAAPETVTESDPPVTIGRVSLLYG